MRKDVNAKLSRITSKNGRLSPKFILNRARGRMRSGTQFWKKVRGRKWSKFPIRQHVRCGAPEVNLEAAELCGKMGQVLDKQTPPYVCMALGCDPALQRCGTRLRSGPTD